MQREWWFPKKEVGQATRFATTHCFNVRVNTKQMEQELLELPLEQRTEFALKRGVCFNCVKPNHRMWQCRAKRVCSKCTNQHHTVLHGTYEGARCQEQTASRQSNHWAQPSVTSGVRHQSEESSW